MAFPCQVLKNTVSCNLYHSYYLQLSCKHTNINKTHGKNVSICCQPASLAILVTSTVLMLPATRWEVLWLGTRSAHAFLWCTRHWLLPANSIILTHTIHTHNTHRHPFCHKDISSSVSAPVHTAVGLELSCNALLLSKMYFCFLDIDINNSRDIF